MKIRMVLAFLICVFVVTPLLADPPAQSGIVVRGETDELGFIWADEARGYWIVLGLDFFGLCQTGNEVWDIWTYKDNFPPHAKFSHEQLKGDDISTTVYPLFFNDWCADIIAYGTTRVISNGTSPGVVNTHARGLLASPIPGVDAMECRAKVHCVANEDGQCVDKYKAKIVLD